MEEREFTSLRVSSEYADLQQKRDIVLSHRSRIVLLLRLAHVHGHIERGGFHPRFPIEIGVAPLASKIRTRYAVRRIGVYAPLC